MSLIGKSIGNYVIKAKLGEGGMGAVFLGEHPMIGKRVAIKVLLEELASNPDIVDRFFTEAKAVNDIAHPNIVDIVDFGKMKGDAGADIVYFIMEFLDGDSLASRLKRGGLTQQETLHVIAQCCSALAASHRKHIVHRDLKPDNLFLLRRGGDTNYVKILDFGIAKLTGDGAGSQKTRAGLVIGTPAYMSPEQCEGKGQIDHRSDVYSLGVMMYELLTGRVPFPGDGFGEILVAHLTRQPDPPSALNPDIPPEIEAIVLHAIDKDKNRRFQNMDEFAAAVTDPATHMMQYSPLPGYTPKIQPNQGTMVMGGPSAAMRAVPASVTQTGARVTTLSGASGEVTGAGGAPRSGSRAPLFAALAVVLVGGGAGAAFFLTRGTATNTTPAVAAAPAAVEEHAAAPAAAPKEESILITVSSTPAGAHVLRADKGGEDVGVTPFEMKVKKNDPAFDIQLRLDGYRPQTRQVTTGTSKEIIVDLAKMEAAPAPVAAAPASDPKPAAAAPKPGAVKKDRPAASGKKKKDGFDTDGVMVPQF